MGGGESKPVETKTVDAAGAINNNLVFNPDNPVPIHHRTIEILLWIICIIKVIELCICAYKVHFKCLKKKYSNSPA